MENQITRGKLTPVKVPGYFVPDEAPAHAPCLAPTRTGSEKMTSRKLLIWLFHAQLQVRVLIAPSVTMILCSMVFIYFLYFNTSDVYQKKIYLKNTSLQSSVNALNCWKVGFLIVVCFCMSSTSNSPSIDLYTIHFAKFSNCWRINRLVLTKVI